MPADDLPVLAFGSAQSWEDWLAEFHESAPALWLKIAKPGAPAPTVTYAEAIEVALCHGWIDGQKGKLDERHWLPRFTPRKPGSRWSKINREKAERLITAGRMRPAGLRQVEAAQAGGRWGGGVEGEGDR